MPRRGSSSVDAETLAIRQRLKDDFPHYAGKCLKIIDKVSNAVTPFQFNTAQRFLHERLEDQKKRTGKVRAIILKGRQQGCSTYIGARFYWQVSHREGVKAFILTHEKSATSNLFAMTQRYHINCPEVVRPQASVDSADELRFGGLDSGYKVGTAGSRATGRSSTIQYFHGSEVAHWPFAEEHAMGILQAIPPADNTEMILESTANGMGNYYHKTWCQAEAGNGDIEAIFLPWYWQEEYAIPKPEGATLSLTEEEAEYQELYKLSDEQIAWVGMKVAEFGGEWDRFHQEYPATPTLAFQFSGEESLIKPGEVMAARNEVIKEPTGPKLLGVDPARFGDDRTGIIRRQGRKSYELEYHNGLDTMQVAGLVAKIIRDEKIDRCFIDVGGLGAGVVDRLREMGYSNKVVAVNAGAKAMSPSKYHNKRAEIWGLMKEWFDDKPVQIPDDDALQADLCGPGYSYDSNSRLKLERKEDMNKRGLASPDGGDALAQTFAHPVAGSLNDTLNYDDTWIV